MRPGVDRDVGRRVGRRVGRHTGRHAGRRARLRPVQRDGGRPTSGVSRLVEDEHELVAVGVDGVVVVWVAREYGDEPRPLAAAPVR